MKKLAKIFHEHGDDSFLLPSALPFSRCAMRDYLCERIFGPADARILIRSEREQLLLYGSNPITRDALRKYLFVVVDGMADDMTSPRRDLTRDSQESRLLRPDSPVNTSTADSSLSEDFENIHHYLTVQKTQQPDIFPDDRKPHRSKSHQMLPLLISDERREDRSTNQQLAFRAPQWIPGERQMDRQMSKNVGTSVLPFGPDQRQYFSNARQPVPYERQMLPLAPQLMPYPGYMMNNYSQPPSYPALNHYYQYLADEERHRQSLYGVPHGLTGPYHQMHHLPPQLYAPPHIPQPPPVNPGHGYHQHGHHQHGHHQHGHHQHDNFVPVLYVPPPVMRPPAPQRLAPKVLRAAVQGYDSNATGLSGHPSTVPRSETTQQSQQSNHPIPPGLARGLQPSKDSAPAESAQPLETSAYVAQSSSAQSHPSSSFSVSSLAQSAQFSLGLGPFPNVMPAVRPLPYQAGSDITKPQGVGASIVKYKDLIRHGRPSYAIAINEGIAPFVRNDKDYKPAQWGVVKVSNVS